jgi:hypothetical protein
MKLSKSTYDSRSENKEKCHLGQIVEQLQRSSKIIHLIMVTIITLCSSVRIYSAVSDKVLFIYFFFFAFGIYC